MNQKELLFISIAVFLTMFAFVINTIYHIYYGPEINREIKRAEIPHVKIDQSIFSVLKNRTQ